LSKYFYHKLIDKVSSPLGEVEKPATLSLFLLFSFPPELNRQRENN